MILPILDEKNIILNLPLMTKREAIQKAANTLIDNGYVSQEYFMSMLERENVGTTYIGNGIAIPHGISHSSDLIHHSGIVILQFKQAIQYDSEEVHLVIGIAGKNNTHIEILSKIAIALLEMETVDHIVKSNSEQEIISLFEFNAESE